MAFVQHSPSSADPAALLLDAAGTRGARPSRPAWLYTAALHPADEPQRIAELHAFAILDTEPDEDFDRLVQLATVLCGTPMGALTLVDSQRQWYKSRVGVPVQQVARDKSFCAHAILETDRVLEIPDVSRLGWADPQPWGAKGPTLGFYAGVPLRTGDGSAIGTLCVMDQVPRRLTDSQRDGLVKLAKAVSSLLNLRRQLRIATETDRLTGLPNWFHFEAEFDHRKPACGMVCFVRLKTINQINSAHGFRVADGLIKQTADRLRVFGEGGAFIGRIKRGLFILFFPDAKPGDFARRIAPELAASLGRPYEVNNLALVCPVNLGFASFPDDGRSLDEVVNAADTALQVAIEREEPMAFFDRSVHNVQSMHYRLEPQLRRALACDEFVNYYQPKVELATGRIVGVEALVRWMDPNRGLVPPGEFVPALETTGLIGEVAQKIMERAIADWCTWRDAGLAAPRVAVNVAATQLRNDDFVPSLRRALAALRGDPVALGIEVTESILISNMERAIEVLQQVRALGVPVAIDDFGTGYSSLAYIVTLPIDELKIDRAFVKKITADKAYEGIVRTCVSLARGLNLKVVAEGVETEAQAIKLRDLQCDQAQGFFYSPPVPADQLVRMLKAGPMVVPGADTPA
ncbi:putative bifunctional diguanylate cyclase/phosphodiesterase [Ramlibacter pallidus]|uniref:EAL domain-containing protein n=1 Tax=Ramlibacter pallidus TaxID=2780087 RepID=A0ABR9S2T4_9BURK|nr:sensor domain-containing phosphodiesterase [Ramlibacter pallidus]MBE7367754.1 EAL domain-containing protein [Ramlibacter pallidus]